MRSLLRKLLNAKVRSYIVRLSANDAPLTLRQAINYAQNQAPIMMYALLQGRRYHPKRRPDEVKKRLAHLVIDAAFKTKKRLLPEIRQPGSSPFSVSSPPDQRVASVFVTSHHGYVSLMMVYLQERGFRFSLVAADPLAQQEFATSVWGASRDLDIFKPNENVLIEIRRRLKERTNVLLCVDYGRPGLRRRDAPQTFISSVGFACAEKLGARIVFVHAKMNRSGQIEFYFEDYGQVRETPLKAADGYLKWLNKIDPTTLDWAVTEKVAT